jgi:hypothetical protein
MVLVQEKNLVLKNRKAEQQQEHQHQEHPRLV